MRGVSGAVAVAVAALLVCCSADQQGQDGNNSEQIETSGHKTREVRDTRHLSGLLPYLAQRRIDESSMGGGHELWPLAEGYFADGPFKRNFDEIDRSGLDPFVGKRNFDEIDLSSMPFPYASKRFYRLYGYNSIDIPPVASFDKKRLYRPDYPMDEIDLSHFPIGSKRSLDSFQIAPHRR